MVKTSKFKRRRRKQKRKTKVDANDATADTDETLELELEMQRLKLNVMNSAEGDLLEEAIKLAAVEKELMQMTCTHGGNDIENGEYIKRFYRAFDTAFHEAREGGLVNRFDEAYKSTVSDFAGVWSDSAKIASVVTLYAAIGTCFFLESTKCNAQLVASIAFQFEEFVKVNIERTQAGIDNCKLIELCSGDDHTLVSFFKKRIPCSCLDEIYKEVKSMKKKGVCWNRDCKYSCLDDEAGSEWKLDRNALMSCARCGIACYCSVECQKADWSKHKESCDYVVARRNAFDEAKCYRAA